MNREKRRATLILALRQLAKSGKRTTSYAYLSWRYGVPESEIKTLMAKQEGAANVKA